MPEQFPINPLTGLRALGFKKSGAPIWPVMGGSQPIQTSPPPEDPPAGPPPADPPSDGKPNAVDQNGNDLGYPVETAAAEMNVEQQRNFYKHQQRRKDDILKGYGGITPEEAKQLKADADKNRRDGLQPSERALEDARSEATTAAMQQAASQWAPLLVEEVVGHFVTDEKQRPVVLAGIDPMKFFKDGKFEKDALVGHLTGLAAAFGGAPPAGSGEPQPRQWGQSSSRPSTTSGKDEGLAEARRRGYIKD